MKVSFVPVVLGLVLSFTGCGGEELSPRRTRAVSPPKALPFQIATDEDQSVNGSLKIWGSRPDSLSASIAGQPANGTITLEGTAFTYTPAKDFTGPARFLTSCGGKADRPPPRLMLKSVRSMTRLPRAAS